MTTQIQSAGKRSVGAKGKKEPLPADILVVRHGTGRGRIPLYGQHILDWLRVQRPDLARRIRVHETGTGPVALDGVRAVFFWLADPLQVRYPLCFEEALWIETEARRRSLAVLNKPSVLSDYGKDKQGKRFKEAGIPSPEAVLIAGTSDLDRCADQLGLPLLLRGSESFGQEKTLIVRTRRSLRSLTCEDLPEKAVATRLVDVRAPRSDGLKQTLWSRYYHRKRVILIGDKCVPYSLFFSRDPVVSQQTSIYRDYRLWQARLRRFGWVGKRTLRMLRGGLGVNRALQLEREFIESPIRHEEVFKRAGAALELEFAAFDAAVLPDGNVVIWEANPYPFLPDSRESIMGHSRNSSAIVLRVYEAFASLFERLVGEASGTQPSTACTP